MRYLFILSVIVCVIYSPGCRRTNSVNVDNIQGLGGDRWESTYIDKWIYDSLTVPFNVEVKYKWDIFEGDIQKTLAPPREDKVLTVLRAIKAVWIDTYVAEAGIDFVKTYIPKQIYLAGSKNYNTDGTITLGQAEGGKKILIYDVNDFDSSNRSKLNQMMHTIQHEFAHILHQTILYTPDYRNICLASDYTATWYNVNLADAWIKGFITPYSMLNYDEDFVEMIAQMLEDGNTRFEQKISALELSVAPAAEKIKLKQQIVEAYYKEVWGIDFRKLQDRVENISNLLTAGG